MAEAAQSRAPDNAVVAWHVLQEAYEQDPDVIAGLFDALKHLQYGSFTIYFERGKIVHGKKEESLKAVRNGGS